MTPDDRRIIDLTSRMAAESRRDAVVTLALAAVVACLHYDILAVVMTVQPILFLRDAVKYRRQAVRFTQVCEVIDRMERDPDHFHVYASKAKGLIQQIQKTL